MKPLYGFIIITPEVIRAEINNRHLATVALTENTIIANVQFVDETDVDRCVGDISFFLKSMFSELICCSQKAQNTGKILTVPA